MKKWLLLICLMMLIPACEPVEVGEPPDFSGLSSATVISESQVALAWSAASDDLLRPEELSYGIWFVESGTDLNLDSEPDILTDEGALSYNLLDLNAETTYTVVVRARDRGSNYSTNQTTRQATTTAADEGDFKKEVAFDLGVSPRQLLKGLVFSGARDDLGVAYEDEIRWYRSRSNGQVTLEPMGISLNTTILRARLVPVRIDFALEDLIVLTENEILYFQNDEGDFDPVGVSFEGSPSFRCLSHVENNLRMAALSYVDALQAARVYTWDEENGFVLEATENLGNNQSEFRLAKLDDDDLYDWVAFGTTGLRVALAGGDPWNFASPTVIDETGPGSASYQLFVLDGDNDGKRDVYVFLRNPSEDETKMWVYRGLGDGGFADRIETNYGGAFYERPSFHLANNDILPDLVIPQSSSNNVAVYVRGSETSPAFDQLEGYFGGFGNADWAFFGNYDGLIGRDLAILSSEGRKLTLLFSNRTR